MVSDVLYYVVDTGVLSGEDVLMYSGSVCRYGWDVWQQASIHNGQYPVPCPAQ